jgi:hypothetical protein
MAEQQPMTTTTAAAPADPAADAQKAYVEAIKSMTDRGLFDRVSAAHPHANTSAEHLKSMVEDYKRLEGERDKAAKG